MPVGPAVLARSLGFAVGLVISTIVFALLALAAAPLPYRARYALITRWSFLNLWWLKVTCRLEHRVEGLEHIPAEPAIVLSKHQSAWETLALQRYFSPQVWVLKRELLRIPFFGWGLATLHPIAIDRSAGRSAVEQILLQGEARLAEGCWVVIFPEGTRVAPGERRKYRQGGARLAEHSGRPVVPVAHNSGDFWPRNSFIKRAGTIRLVIGPPIASSGRSASEINALAEQWIESTVTRIRQPGPGSPHAQTAGERAADRVEGQV